MMVAGLERDVQRRAAAARARVTQRLGLDVKIARPVMIAAPDDAPVGHDDGPDRRIRTGAPQPLAAQAQSLAHVAGVGRRHVATANLYANC